MSAKSKTYADQTSGALLMATALRANLETLKKRGMTEEFIDLLEGSLGSITAKNSEQKRLKAELKTATAAVETLMVKLHGQMREAIKVVKLEEPQPRWKEYGIADKR
jgi:uncharacterized membrane-anchored protein